MKPVLTGALLLWLSLASPSIQAGEIREKLDLQKGELKWAFHGHKLLALAFATNQFKPYVRELCSLAGDNVLRDSPPDHLHHHGLMYAIRINDVNFWEEKTDPGIEKTIQLLSHQTRTSRAGLPQASCSLLIHWLAPVNGSPADAQASPFLIEQRTLTLTVNEAASEVALEWSADFQAGPSAGRLSLHGTDYNGLGMRLPQSFDHVARFQNSAAAPYPGVPSQPTRNVIAAEWSAVSGQINNHPAMVALFGDEENKAGNHFFSLQDAFAYFGVTQRLDQQPLVYNSGDRFHLRFLVTVYPEIKPAEFLNRRYKTWKEGAARK